MATSEEKESKDVEETEESEKGTESPSEELKDEGGEETQESEKGTESPSEELKSNDGEEIEESEKGPESPSEELKDEGGEETEGSEKGTDPPTSYTYPVSAPTYSYSAPVSENETEPSTSNSYPFPSPTNTVPTYPYQTPVYIEPTLRPVVPYVSADDDPLEESNGYDGDSEEWNWNTSSIEELEHDKTVIIALSTVFGVMFFFSIFVAYQMLENPEGCCASICRITVACVCGVLRCVCYPCRAICGCTGQAKRDHMIVPEDGNFSHDLELS